MDGAVFELVVPADAVFDTEQIAVVSVKERVQGNAQALRIGCPAPGVSLQVRVSDLVRLAAAVALARLGVFVMERDDM